MSGWQTALDHKIDVLDWITGNDGLAYLNNFLGSIDERGHLGEREGDPRATFEAAIGGAADDLRRASTLYVHPDLVDLAEAATPSFRPEPFRETDLIAGPSQPVFLSLGRPVTFVDGWGKPTTFSYISWGPRFTRFVSDDDPDPAAKAGIGVLLWSTRADLEKDYASALDDELRGAEGVGPPETWPRSLRLSLLHASIFQFDREIFRAADDVPEGGDYWVRFFEVILRLSMQQITTHAKEVPPRHARRRAERAGIDDPYVLVVKLRRAREGAAGSHRDDDQREWSHRWVVGGHWRNQWYPTLHAHRQIWISDYLKGPEDKPLRVPHGRAYELVR